MCRRAGAVQDQERRSATSLRQTASGAAGCSMNSKLATGLALAVVLIVGCVPTLNTVYRDEDLVFDPNLIGRWQQDQAQNHWEFTQTGPRELQLAYTDGQGRTGQFVAHLAEVGGLRYLDLYPIKTELTESEFYKFHLVPVHTVYLVKSTTPHVELAGFDLAWLNQHLADHPDAIGHIECAGQKVITAPTEELQKFLAANREHFTVELKLIRDAS